MPADVEIVPTSAASTSRRHAAELVPGSAVPSKTVRQRLRAIPLMLALGWVTLVVSASFLAPVISLRDPSQGGLAVAEGPTWGRPFGTDNLGRDMLSRVIYGGRLSLLIAGISIVLAMVVGVALGLLAGYRRGKSDLAITACADVILAFPGLIVLTVVSVLVGSSVKNLIIVIAVLRVPVFMRLARAGTMSVVDREFVLAAKGIGAPGLRVARREVLPNLLASITAYAFAAAGIVFVLEGSLSFLGLGIQPPTPAWGTMIAGGRPMLVDAPHIVLIPATVLFLTVLALNVISDAKTAGGGKARLGE